MTDAMTSQNIDISSWDILYNKMLDANFRLRGNDFKPVIPSGVQWVAIMP
jgi:hypothetical protein